MGTRGVAYYVDATAGNDANSGRSPGAAWQTIGKVNGSAFLPGDHILFKRGETWTGTTLTVPSSGVAGSPIVFGVYGTGAKPIIDGNDLVDCVSTNGNDYLRFEYLDITQGLDFGFVIANVHDVILFECDAHDCGNDNVNFDGSYDCAVYGGEFYNQYVRVNDNRFVCGIELKDTCHDILIDGAECYGGVGVAAPAHYGAGIGLVNHPGFDLAYNITIRNCYVHDEGLNCFGVRANNANAAAMTDRNVLIEDNLVQANAYGGIQINASAGVAFRSDGFTIRDNTILLNTGSFGLMLVNVNNCAAYRNVITNNNNSTNQNMNLQECTNVDIWNNTTYSWFDNFWFSVAISGATTANLVLLNNIIGGAIASMMNISVAAGTGVGTLTIDYNLYQYAGAGNRWNWLGANVNYAAWQAAGNDANSPARGNPLFTNPAGDDYTLQVGSPAINAGTDVGLPYCEAAPDCGYWEYCP